MDIKLFEFLSKEVPNSVSEIREALDLLSSSIESAIDQVAEKVIYFSRVKLPNMRAPRKIESADLYIETNLSANSVRNIITKSLNKYNIRLNNYKVYLKADYSELHR